MTNRAVEQSGGAYRVIWRWHFYAGLLVTPVLLLLAVTGSLYLFDRELAKWWDSDFATVQVGETYRPLAEQELVAQSVDPTAKVKRVILPFAPDDTAKWLLQGQDGRLHEINVNPYTLSITGIRNPDDAPMPVVRRLHGTILGGEIGSYIIELTACWTLVMLATGLWMWWPKRPKFRGVFWPRFSSGGRRLLRDLHAIPAALISVFVIGLILTGLPWSVFWGVQLAKIGEVVPFIEPTPNFSSHSPAPVKAGTVAGVPATTADPHKHMDHAQHSAPSTDPAAANIPWVIQHSPQAKGGHARLRISDVEPHLAMLDREQYGAGVRIFYPDGPGGTFMINYVPDQAEGQRTIIIDPQNGHMLSDIGWKDYSAGGKAIEWGTMVHMGRQYGPVNQLFNLSICLSLIAAVVFGIVHWWRRRPKGQMGAPTKRQGQGLPTGLKSVLLAMAVMFPLVGATMVPVLLYGAFNARRRVQPA